MMKKVVKFALAFLSTMIIARLILTGQKEMVAIAFLALFAIPYVYNDKSNIYSFARAIKAKRLQNIIVDK